MNTYFIIATVILALAPAIVGLWWWRKGAGGIVFLFAVFVSIASLVMLPVTKTMPVWLFYTLDMTDSFTTLLILPLLFYILTRITKYHYSKEVLALWFLPPILAGVLNAVMHFIAFFTPEGVAKIREIGLAEGTLTLFPENLPQMVIFVNYDVYNVLLFLQVIAFVFSLVYIIKRYNNSIESYYVDLQFTDCMYVRNIANTMMVTVVALYLELVMQRDTANDYSIITILYLMVSFIVIWVIGWNLSRIEGDTLVLYLQESSFSSEELADFENNHKVELEESESAKDDSGTYAAGQSQYIENLIKKWVNCSDKPYLKEGITINDVADNIGISSRTLSVHLNHAMNQNFNSWINNLRIEEAKTMFRQDTSLCGSYVALKCGFADAAMLSKNFKRVTGMTITEYKRSEV